MLWPHQDHGLCNGSGWVHHMTEVYFYHQEKHHIVWLWVHLCRCSQQPGCSAKLVGPEWLHPDQSDESTNTHHTFHSDSDQQVNHLPNQRLSIRAIPNAEVTFWVSNRVYKIIEKIGISDNIPAVLHMCALIYCNKLEKKSLNLMNYSFFWNKHAIRKPNALSDDFQPIPCYPSKQISGNCSLTFGFRVIRTWKYFRKWWKLEETKQNPLPQGG